MLPHYSEREFDIMWKHLVNVQLNNRKYAVCECKMAYLRLLNNSLNCLVKIGGYALKEYHN